MTVYPQLTTGAIAQYPLSKLQTMRTVTNLVPDGSSVKFFDPGAGTTEWQLSYQALTDAERDTLEKFFQDMEGSLLTFTFLDPAGNLLSHSEDLNDPNWETDPLLTVSAGGSGPSESQGALLTNSSGAAQSIRQRLSAPNSYQYCASLYARSDLGGSVLTVQLGEKKADFNLSPDWRRLVLSSDGGSEEDAVTFAITVPSGAIEISGVQLEAQAGASGYKPTHGRGGVYPDARFSHDVLRFTTDDLNHHSCRVRIIHAEHI